METIRLELPAALLQAADLDDSNVAQEVARLLTRLWPLSWTSPLTTAFRPCITAAPIWRKNACLLTG
jgi:hypothetical protein